MAGQGNALRSGVFIVASAVVSLALVVVVSGPERFASKTDYVAVFRVEDDLQGVRAGDEVRLGGLRVGTVRSVVVDADKEPAEIRVTMTLPSKYVIKEGATVSVGGLIGSAWLNFDSLGTGSRLPPGGIVAGGPSALTRLGLMAPKIDAAIEEVRTRTLPRVNQTIEEYRLLAADARSKGLPELAQAAETARRMLEDVRAQVTPIVERYFGVADAARGAMDNIGALVGPKGGPTNFDFAQTLENLSKTTALLREEVPQITARVKTALDLMNQRLTSLQQVVEDLKEAMSNVREGSGEVRSVLLDNRAKIDRIVSSVEETTRNARNFTAEILRRPSRLLWKDDPKTQGNLTVYHSAREFASGAQELNDAAAMLRDAMRDPRISKEELHRRVQLLEAAFDRFGEVEERLYRSVRP